MSGSANPLEGASGMFLCVPIFSLFNRRTYTQRGWEKGSVEGYKGEKATGYWQGNRAGWKEKWERTDLWRAIAWGNQMFADKSSSFSTRKNQQTFLARS